MRGKKQGTPALQGFLGHSPLFNSPGAGLSLRPPLPESPVGQEKCCRLVAISCNSSLKISDSEHTQDSFSRLAGFSMTHALQKCLGWINRNRIQKGAHFPELLFTRYKLYWDFFKQQLRNTASALLISRKIHMKTTTGTTSPIQNGHQQKDYWQ